MSTIDVEEIHTILKGLTRVQNHKNDGKYVENEDADYSLILKWFKQCRIIDGRIITENFFNISYERLAPNREKLTLAQMVTLFGILSRDTDQEIDAIAKKFEAVKDEVIQEIRNYWKQVVESPDTTQNINTESSNYAGGITFNF